MKYVVKATNSSVDVASVIGNEVILTLPKRYFEAEMVEELVGSAVYDMFYKANRVSGEIQYVGFSHTELLVIKHEVARAGVELNVSVVETLLVTEIAVEKATPVVPLKVNTVNEVVETKEDENSFEKAVSLLKSLFNKSAGVETEKSAVVKVNTVAGKKESTDVKVNVKENNINTKEPTVVKVNNTVAGKKVSLAERALQRREAKNTKFEPIKSVIPPKLIAIECFDYASTKLLKLIGNKSLKGSIEDGLEKFVNEAIAKENIVCNKTIKLIQGLLNELDTVIDTIAKNPDAPTVEEWTEGLNIIQEELKVEKAKIIKK